MKRGARHWWLLAALGAAVVAGPGTVEWVRLALAQRRLDRQLEALSARRRQLRDEQRRLESDDAYVEGLFRSTFKVARPGEYVIPAEDIAHPPVDAQDRRGLTPLGSDP